MRGSEGTSARAPALVSTADARAFSRSWFQDLRRRVIDERQPYVLSSAEMPHEIFDALGLPVVTAEWWAGVVSAKRMAGRYLDWLQERGFHGRLGGYNALGLVTLFADDVPDPPWGGLPPPALLCAPLREQSVERAWELAGDKLGIPFVRIDVPASTRFYPRWWEMSRRGWEDLYETDRIDVMLAQYRDLVAQAQGIAGRRLDTERLRAILERINEQEECFDQARALIAAAPKCPVRVSEQMSNTMTAQWHRGSAWALDHARTFRDEVDERVAAGTAVCADERIRLMWIGVGLWQNTAFYEAFEESHGAVFVWSMYLAIAADGYIKYGLKDPLRALAARYLNLGEQMHVPPWAGAWVVEEARRHRIDAAVMIVSPALRHQVAGNLFQKLALEEAGIPVLELTIDPSDNRVWDEAQIHSEVGTFLKEKVSR